jgi:hypothetical protein
MATGMNDSEYVSYPMFKGLQKPLEFMGIQGRYITWAACAVGGAIIGFIIVYCFFGFVAGLITLVSSIVLVRFLFSSNRRKDCTPRRKTMVCSSMLVQKECNKHRVKL